MLTRASRPRNFVPGVGPTQAFYRSHNLRTNSESTPDPRLVPWGSARIGRAGFRKVGFRAARSRHNIKVTKPRRSNPRV